MRLMIAPDREKTIDNIRQAAAAGRLNVTVEPNDAPLTDALRKSVTQAFATREEQPLFGLRHWLSRRMTDTISWCCGAGVEIVGWRKLKDLRGGAVLTSNHFNPYDNIVLRRLAQKLHKGHLNIVSYLGNFLLPGTLGYIVRHGDVVPITCSHDFLEHVFDDTLQQMFGRNEWLLVYPEQEMWFNYRKPRPLKRGAYLYAAKYDVPVISCFVEILATDDMQTPYFRKVRCRLHVLDTLFPDPSLSDRENSVVMCRQDYQQKCACYEACYGKPLDYAFTSWDIAGWEPSAESVRGFAALQAAVARELAEKALDAAEDEPQTC